MLRTITSDITTFTGNFIKLYVPRNSSGTLLNFIREQAEQLWFVMIYIKIPLRIDLYHFLFIYLNIHVNCITFTSKTLER